MWLVVGLAIAALVFEFMYGYANAANAIATVVSTGVLRVGQAVALATVFHLLAMFVVPLGVAQTFAQGLADPAVLDLHVAFGALAGALGWHVLSRFVSVPGSSCHALVGGIVGAVAAKAGPAALGGAELVRTLLFVTLSPLLGLLLAALALLGISWLFRRATPSRVDRWFRPLQLISASALALMRGGHDAQKAIGILWMVLIASGSVSVGAPAPPTWVVIGGFLAIGAGTLFGGWRIVRMMGQRLTRLKPVHGFCAEAGGALALLTSLVLAVPVSTTHTSSAAIVGVGSVRRARGLHGFQSGRIVLAWVITVPLSALAGALAYRAARMLF